jgi:hypothetical protein
MNGTFESWSNHIAEEFTESMKRSGVPTETIEMRAGMSTIPGTERGSGAGAGLDYMRRQAAAARSVGFRS